MEELRFILVLFALARRGTTMGLLMMFDVDLQFVKQKAEIVRGRISLMMIRAKARGRNKFVYEVTIKPAIYVLYNTVGYDFVGSFWRAIKTIP